MLMTEGEGAWGLDEGAPQCCCPLHFGRIVGVSLIFREKHMKNKLLLNEIF